MVVQVSKNFIRIDFNHKKPESFVRSQWQSGNKSVLFLIFRWFLAAYFFGCVSYAWTNNIIDGTFGYWFIYMTNWGISICTISTIYAAILTTLHHFQKIDLTTESRSYKILWWLSNVSTVLAFKITIVYWALLFNGEWIFRRLWNLRNLSILIAKGETSIIDVWIHAGNSLGMLLEIIVARYTYRAFHFVYPILVGLIYLIFTLIYYYAGGVDSKGNNYIYSILNWGEKPLSAAIVVLGVMFLLIFLHIIALIIQKGRKRIFNRCCARATLEINGNATQTVWLFYLII